MLVAILSDIHGNLEAFQSVIDNLEKHKPDKVICLGDLIGYGPNPEEIIQLFKSKGYISVLGNHEAALHEKKMRNWLNFQAKENSIHTEKLLSRDSLKFCCNLPRTLVLEEALFVHGFPPDSVLHYVTMMSDKELFQFFDRSVGDLFFVGHTHDLFIVRWDGKKLRKEKVTAKSYVLEKGVKYIINAGSVGQPRDGDNSAKYILWNSETNILEIVYVPYDYRATTQKIKERGFPDAYGYRLR